MLKHHFCCGPFHPPPPPHPYKSQMHLTCISTYTVPSPIGNTKSSIPPSAVPESVSVDMMAEGIKGATDHRSTYGEKLDIEGGGGGGGG
jgi:hypothetical protein